MSSRIACWLNGHRWGAWSSKPWQNVFGVEFAVRFCGQCGARQTRGWS